MAFYSHPTVLLVTPILALLFLPIGTGLAAKLPKSIEYYSHAPVVGTVLLPPAYPGSSSNFGSISLYTVTLTEEQDLQSKQVGIIRGLEVQTDPAPTNSTSLALGTISYDDGKYSGTLQLHGIFPEVAVVGGTGDFAGATGVLYVKLLAEHDNILLFHHTVKFVARCSTLAKVTQ